MTYVFLQMLPVTLLLTPIITMRSFAEERKQKTDQALLIAPVSLVEIVFGKFLGAFLLFCACNVIYILFAIILCFYSAPDWGMLCSTLLGMMLLGGALIAIDIFISVLTESQVIAAVISLGVGLLIFNLNSIAKIISTDWLVDFIYSISFDNHFTNFINGIISLPSIIFFLSVIAIFLFLCVRVLEKRRWS